MRKGLVYSLHICLYLFNSLVIHCTLVFITRSSPSYSLDFLKVTPTPILHFRTQITVFVKFSTVLTEVIIIFMTIDFKSTLNIHNFFGFIIFYSYNTTSQGHWTLIHLTTVLNPTLSLFLWSIFLSLVLTVFYLPAVLWTFLWTKHNNYSRLLVTRSYSVPLLSIGII